MSAPVGSGGRQPAYHEKPVRPRGRQFDVVASCLQLREHPGLDAKNRVCGARHVIEEAPSADGAQDTLRQQPAHLGGILDERFCALRGFPGLDRWCSRF
jgi:hypothetical protein